MRRSLIHLLCTIGRQAALVVAIMAMVMSVVQAPCLLPIDQGGDTSIALQMVSDGSSGDHGTPDADDCGHCHCAASAFCVVPDALLHVLPTLDGRSLKCPISCQAPEGLAHSPDVPPDQA